ncbi:hypothetical protein BN903_36 [Halorubrum sp. AJ67]|nr:hypothetical protein BN903_36 [Halorubrum sp. AJ67]
MSPTRSQPHSTSHLPSLVGRLHFAPATDSLARCSSRPPSAARSEARATALFFIDGPRRRSDLFKCTLTDSGL